MNLLFLAAFAPYPPADGDRIRALSTLRQLARDHDVFGFFLDTEGRGGGLPGPLKRLLSGWRTVPVGRLSRLRSAALAGARRQPVHSGSFWSPEAQRALDDCVRKWNPAGLHVHRIRMMPYAERAGRPYVLDITDCMSWYYRHAAHLKGWRRWYAAYDLPVLRRSERRWANGAAASLVITPQERSRLRAIGVTRPVYVIPNAIDLARWRPSARRRDRRRLLFVGNLGYPPNVAGLRWFLSSGAAAAVARLLPRARLDVIGTGAPSDLTRLGRRSALPVRFIGFRADVRPCLWNASVLVCPLPVASGLQNKALQAMACGLPVVTTPNVARGIGASRREVAIVSTPSACAAAVARLVNRPRAAAAMAARAFRLVRGRFSEPRVRAAMRPAYRRLAAGG